MKSLKYAALALLLQVPVSYGMDDDNIPCSQARYLTTVCGCGAALFGAIKYVEIKREEQHRDRIRKKYDVERMMIERELQADESVLFLNQHSRSMDEINHAERADLIPRMYDVMPEICCCCTLFWGLSLLSCSK